VQLGEKVINLVKREDGIFELHTDHRIHLSRAVIITAGIGAFTPKSLPGDNVKKFEGNGIYYYIDDLKRYKDRRVLVVGGGDTAVDFALMLEGMLHRLNFAGRISETAYIWRLKDEGARFAVSISSLSLPSGISLPVSKKFIERLSLMA
jgi:thioredoxin reductase (NADPH)